MAFDWLRLYHGTVNDPKFRVVAKKAGVPVHQVLAVWMAMLECASQNTPRGTIEGWDDEDEAEALDMDANAIERIRTHMNAKVLDGCVLIGWARRQPKREDGSAERASAWRKRKKEDANANERTRTQPNTDKIRLDKNKIEPPIVPLGDDDPPIKKTRGNQIPDGWEPTEHAYAVGTDQNFSRDEVDQLAVSFRDYWRGAGKAKKDWNATFYNHLRSSMAHRDVFHWRKDAVSSGDPPISDEQRARIQAAAKANTERIERGEMNLHNEAVRKFGGGVIYETLEAWRNRKDAAA